MNCPHCKIELPDLEKGHRYSCPCGDWFQITESGEVLPYTPDALETGINALFRRSEKASKAILN